MRGKLTEELKLKAKELLNIDDLSTIELRLMPYIQYVMVNNQAIEPHKITTEERLILTKWRELGFIEGGATGLKVSKIFWDGINELIWLSYVISE